ncbi:MAG: hypothetical protein GX621_19020, partial [Pirellulaceae bacterium]|nr:hypothetical protein [Pirellulaceae bacterium]
MSIFRLPQLRNLASGVDRIRDRFLGRRADASVTERAFRRLAVDALEERHLLSVSPMGPVDHLVNQSFWGDATDTSSLWHNYTTMGQSVAVDHDGDFVVTWTRYDLVVDPNTGEFVIDPKTGEYMTDANIYARYFTDETQRVTLPDALGVDNVPGNFFSTFSLRVGGNEIQKISFSTA